jgi:hypothetical protein
VRRPSAAQLWSRLVVTSTAGLSRSIGFVIMWMTATTVETLPAVVRAAWVPACSGGPLSTLRLGEIPANISEFAWPFEESPFPLLPFFSGC